MAAEYGWLQSRAVSQIRGDPSQRGPLRLSIDNHVDQNGSVHGSFRDPRLPPEKDSPLFPILWPSAQEPHLWLIAIEAFNWTRHLP